MTSVAAGVEARAVEMVPAGPDDTALLAGLYVSLAAAHGETTLPGDAEAKLGRMLSAPGVGAVLFGHGSETLGYALWADLGDHVFLRNMVLAPAWRRQGLGSGLFARLRREVWGPGRPVRLEVSGERQRAFWERQGLGAWSTGMRTDARAGTG